MLIASTTTSYALMRHSGVEIHSSQHVDGQPLAGLNQTVVVGPQRIAAFVATVV
jgi:hypothetical protein